MVQRCVRACAALLLTDACLALGLGALAPLAEGPWGILPQPRRTKAPAAGRATTSQLSAGGAALRWFAPSSAAAGCACQCHAHAAAHCAWGACDAVRKVVPRPRCSHALCPSRDRSAGWLMLTRLRPLPLNAACRAPLTPLASTSTRSVPVGRHDVRCQLLGPTSAVRASVVWGPAARSMLAMLLTHRRGTCGPAAASHSVRSKSLGRALPVAAGRTGPLAGC